ncbi:MAG: glycosyltransferase family 2 protein [Anaerolineae bacterium]
MTDYTSTRAPRASVIIPNWNGMGLLRPCLNSLRRQTIRDFEVIVVDNASTDGSQAALAEEYPEVRVLAQTRNLGFAAGCNAGIAAALGDVLVMLNNDTEVDPAWLAALVDALDRYPEAGSAASRIMLFDNRRVLHSAGDLYQSNGLPNSRGVWQPYGPPYDVEEPVFGGCGGAVAYRRAMLEDVGLFEEAFFMYCEDVDLNWRAQLAGWPCIYVPQAVVYHHLSATGGGKLASFFVGRNTIWVIARNVPSGVCKRHRRAMIAAQKTILWDALRSWRGEAARARLRGVLAGVLTWRRWRAQRQALQAGSRVSEDYIESLLA